MTHQEILQSALKQRLEEELHYQVNIDNFRLALVKIAAEYTGDSPVDLALQEYAKQIEGLLQSSIIEQTKTRVLREVIEQQLKEMDNAAD